MSASMLQQGRAWLKRGWIYLLVALFILIGAFIRSYRMDELMNFSGDQGRDVAIVQRMLETGTPTLLGPGSGIGQFRRGPAYYYLLLPALWLSGGNPLSGGLFIILVDAAAIGMVFVVGRALVGPLAGLSAAILYACAQIPLEMMHNFSNPALLPFFSLVMVYAFRRILQGDDRFLLLLLGAWWVAWQLHDHIWLLMFVMIAAALWFRPRIRVSTWLWAGGLSVVLLLPFLWYEATHNAANLRAMVAYVTGALTRGSSENGVGGAPLREAQTLEFMARLMSDAVVTKTLWLVGVLASAALLVWRAQRETQGAQLLLFYATVPLLFLFWPGPIYPLNIAIALPVPCLVLGYGIQRWADASPRWGYAALAVVGVFGLINAYGLYARTRIWELEPDHLATVRAVVARLNAWSSGKPFVFEYVVQTRNPEIASPYLYLLKQSGAAVTDDAEAMHMRVYSPAALANTTDGTMLNGVRLVAYTAPQVQGDNLLKARWSLRGQETKENAPREAASEIVLRANEISETTNAMQRVPIIPNALYLLQFECRSDLTQGEQRVYLQALNAGGDVVKTYPLGGGYLCPPSETWTRGSILAETSAQARTLRIYLRNLGTGTTWFRNVQLHQAAVDPIQ